MIGHQAEGGSNYVVVAGCASRWCEVFGEAFYGTGCRATANPGRVLGVEGCVF